MKKKLLLSVCLIFTCGVSACVNTTYENNEPEVYISDTDLQSIPSNQCMEGDINCNTSALVNYTKTEADYKLYGERTKESHLYTQASTGNNITSTIAPGIEKDIVTKTTKNTTTVEEVEIGSGNVIVTDNIKNKKQKKYSVDNGVFSKTATLELETTPEITSNVTTIKKPIKKQVVTETIVEETISSDIAQAPKQEAIIKDKNAENEIEIANNIEIIDIKKKNTDAVSVTKTTNIKTETFIESEITSNVSKQTAENTASNTDVADTEEEVKVEPQEEIITTYTEESFDIKDYVNKNELKQVEAEVKKTEIKNDIDVTEIRISDSTVVTWEANEGDNLKDLLTKWSTMSDWKLLWKTNRNYTLTAGVMFKGKFTDVSSALIRAFARARPAPIATYYKGNRVIVIETMENENAY